MTSDISIFEAIKEAKRCLNCAKPMCRTGCPIENDIPNFVKALSQGNIGLANSIIAERSNLPAVCGRVCPHEKQCEAHCILTKKNAGIKIGTLEKFIADFSEDAHINQTPKITPRDGKIAVIGSGPAGLTVAGDLAKLGFEVTVFEAQPELGGVLLFGIPNFRLDKEIVKREIEKIARLGVKFKTGVLVGIDITVDQLFDDGYEAIFIGTGTALPQVLNLPGANLNGIITATYLLSTVTLVKNGHLDAKEIPVAPKDRVIVIGAGNVAMDAARTALRLGASKVTVCYRRDKNFITALESEYDAAVNEGVEFKWMANPCRYIGNNSLSGLVVELMKYDENGEYKTTGHVEVLPADKVVLAVGQRPAARIVSSTKGINVDEKGYVITKERPYGMTTRPGVFAGGDVVHGPATVVLAMREAKKVAQGIAMYLEAKKLLDECTD